jgi:hypothetical protein
MRRISRTALAVAATTLSLVAGTAPAEQITHHLLAAQRGGRVHAAWPHSRHGRPSSALGRWLARQVGPIRVTRRPPKRAAGDGQARAAAATSVPFQITGTPGVLSLVRSYQIPLDDPSVTRLANLSWTYDSAVTSIAFTELGDSAQSVQLLDQLAALQRADGSIDFAFNTSNGQSIPEFRAGTIAWVGLAAVDYRSLTCSTRYDNLAYGAAKWLVSEQNASAGAAGQGLIVGGPDVSWISTQHNFVARAFLARLADQIGGHLGNGNGNGNSKCAGGLTGLSPSQLAAFTSQLRTAVSAIDAGINRALFVRLTPASKTSAGTAYFRQGVGDDTRAADAQALGALWLLGQGRSSDAQAVINYANQALYITNRSVVKSADPSTYNETYASPGPFSGYHPYADPGSPDVLWAEGTFEMRFAEAALGDNTSALDQSLMGWQMITGAATGPLQADRTVTGSVFNEYHPWPAAAPAAWELLNLTSFSMLSGS